MILAKVVDRDLLSVPEGELRNLGLQPGDQVALEIKGSPHSQRLLSRAEKERILNETRGLWANIPDLLFDQIMSEIKRTYEDWDRNLDADSGGHRDSN